EQLVGIGGAAPDAEVPGLVAEPLRQVVGGDAGSRVVDRLEDPRLPADRGHPRSLEPSQVAEQLSELLVARRHARPGRQRRPVAYLAESWSNRRWQPAPQKYTRRPPTSDT